MVPQQSNMYITMCQKKLKHTNLHFFQTTTPFVTVQENCLLLNMFFNKMKSAADQGLNTSLCSWILDFHTEQPQTLQISNTNTTMLSTGAPQGCILSLLLTHNSTSSSSTNHMIKFTTIAGFISNNNGIIQRGGARTTTKNQKK